ncbi:MAG: DNA recombination protein RmuC [Verrucomicrobia bacterium]|nr:DNA recombination protein RmuC [Verrucomicrobiota bacterium]
MDNIGFWVALAAVALGAVGVIVCLLSRSRDKEALAALRQQAELIPGLQEELVRKEEELGKNREALNQSQRDLASVRATLESERTAFASLELKQRQTLEEAEKKFCDIFKSLSADTLKSANAELLKLAEQKFREQQKGSESELDKRKTAIEALLKPVSEQMEKLRSSNEVMEKERVGAYKALDARLQNLLQTQQSLDMQTRKLVESLRKPQVRGSWGEIQLRRIVELSGMLEHCDFDEQVSMASNEGNRMRPDMLVNLPGDKVIVVDSKVPLESYLNALEAHEPAQQKQYLENHVRQLKARISELNSKDYTRNIGRPFRFAVMFVPGEGIFSAAWNQDPELIEFAYKNNVLIATPVTLIALLETIAQAWAESKLTDEIVKIQNNAGVLYDRMRVLLKHIADLGGHIKRGAESYNGLISSLELRFLPAALEMQKQSHLLNVKNPELAQLSLVETIVSSPRSTASETAEE